MDQDKGSRQMSVDVKSRALSYVRAAYKGRNIRVATYDDCTFEMESGKDFSGKTYWFEVAYVGSMNGKFFIVDKTGDIDTILAML